MFPKKIKQSDIIADMHTHTISSLHAYSTLKENIDCAKRRLKYIAITDHLYLHNDEDIRKNEFLRMAYLEQTINSYEKGMNNPHLHYVKKCGFHCCKNNLLNNIHNKRCVHNTTIPS